MKYKNFCASVLCNRASTTISLSSFAFIESLFSVWPNAHNADDKTAKCKTVLADIFIFFAI